MCSLKSQGLPRYRTFGSHWLHIGNQKEQPFLGTVLCREAGREGLGTSQGSSRLGHGRNRNEKRSNSAHARERSGTGTGAGRGGCGDEGDAGGAGVWGPGPPGLSPRANVAMLPSTSPAMAAAPELHHGPAEPTRRRLASASPTRSSLPFPSLPRIRVGQAGLFLPGRC